MNTIKCKKCGSCEMVKAGFVHNKQRFKCKTCKSYFLPGISKTYPMSEKYKAIELYLEGMSIRGIGRYLKLSHVTIIRWIKLLAPQLKPVLPHYTNEIEIDEIYFYVKNKKKRRWLWLAICRESKRILGFQVGGRGSATLRKLFYRINPIQVKAYYTDRHAPYKKVLPKDKNHCKSGMTNTIEGINCSVRRYLARFHRRTVCYSKSLRMVEMSLNLLMYKFDQRYMSLGNNSDDNSIDLRC